MRLTGLLVGLVIVVLLAGSTTVTSGSTAASHSTLRVISSDNQSVVLELTVAGFQRETVTYAGQQYDQLTAQDMTQTVTPGRPQVPTRGTLVGLAVAEGVRLELLDSRSEILRGYRLAPAPALTAGSDAPQRVPTATTDAFYPEIPVELGEVGYMRDQAVAQVQFYPVQYNPVTGQVRQYRHIRVRLTWDAAPALAAAPTTGNPPAYEDLLRNTLLNYADLERPSATPPASGTTASQSLPTTRSSASPAFKISVRAAGIYQVTPADLTRAGLDPTGIDPRTFKLRHGDQDIPIYVQGEADGRFDAGDYLLFYGTGLDTRYTDTNVYWLTVGGSAGLRMPVRDGTPDGRAVTPTHFPATLHAEQNSYYWPGMPAGAGTDYWFWDRKLNASSKTVARDHTLTLRNIAQAAEEVRVRVRLQGFTAVSANPDHRTRIFLNGRQIDEQSWDGQVPFTHDITVPHTYLREGDNTLRVESVQLSGVPVNQIFVDWIKVDYQDSYTAENDQLQFSAPEQGTFAFAVTNFSQQSITLFDITDPPQVTRISHPAIVAANGRYTLRFQDSATAATRYLAQTTAQYKTPAGIELDTPSSWKDPQNGADYILITHGDFYAGAQRLAEHRRTAGMRVATVRVEDLYDEFNGGVFGPDAIRNFLQYAYQNWQRPAPSYVLLLGDAHVDYRNYQDMPGAVNYVPTQMVPAAIDLRDVPSDNWFVTVNGADILPDMFIGRLAVQSVAQADAVIDKLIAYDQSPADQPWQRRVLLAADDGAPEYVANSEELAGRLPGDYTVRRVYAEEYPPGNPTSDIIDAFDAGSLLVNYTGHGSVGGWGIWRSGNRIFEHTNVAQLRNTDKLPVVTVANCLNGYFVGEPDPVSLAEELQRLPEGGAVAVWAASGLDFPSGHRRLFGNFYDALFQEQIYGLGAATTSAKIKTYSGSAFWKDLINTFTLFGDPATALKAPQSAPEPTPDPTSDPDLKPTPDPDPAPQPTVEPLPGKEEALLYLPLIAR
ncbi:MAG: C25 family cysteine peptidase [Chloroflexaceae bacterium]